MIVFILEEEIVQADVKVLPHVRVVVDSADAFRSRWSFNVVHPSNLTTQTVNHDVFQVEVLSHAVTKTVERPRVHQLKGLR